LVHGREMVEYKGESSDFYHSGSCTSFVLVVFYAGEQKLPVIDLNHLHFNHANQTYTVNQSLYVWGS